LIATNSQLGRFFEGLRVPAIRISLLEMIRKSGLLEAEVIDQFVQKNLPEPSISNEDMAARFIQAGLLTRFQADLLLQGKYRGFIIKNKYKMLKLIGSGGMGRVFLCEHMMLHRLVALKVLPTDLASDAGNVARFFREARAIAAMDDPNIVRVYDVEQEGKTPLIVMEYVEGRTLQELVAKHGPISFEQAANYIAQAALGLQHASEKGLVHRDIKPGNLLVDQRGVVKILDLGLARFLHPRKDDGVTKRFDTDAVLGTADYLAPEQAVNSSTVDTRADIYALGGTFHFLLTGKTPYDKPTVAEKLLAHQMGPLPDTRNFRPDLPVQMELVIHKMLSKKVADRYQTPKEIVEGLAGLADPNRPIPPQILIIAPGSDRFSSATTTTTGSTDLRRVPISSKSVAILQPRSDELPRNTKRWLWISLIASSLVLVTGISVVLISLANRPNTTEVTQAANAPINNRPIDPNLDLTPPSRAGEMIGKVITSEFKIVRTGYSNSKTRLFLNSSRSLNDPGRLTILISSDASEKLYPDIKFEDLDKKFENKLVRIKGLVTLYKDAKSKVDQVQIHVEEADQLKILD
jgi:serine/threonine protein kinase